MSRYLFSRASDVVVLALVVFTLIGCGVTDTRKNDRPVADFTWSDEGRGPTAISFHNLSANADRFLWRFPGGLTSPTSDPVYSFGSSGVHNVTLIASDESTGRVDSLTRTLTIMPSRFLLDSVIVGQIPFRNPRGSSWDDLTGPDLYYIVYKPNGAYESSSFQYRTEDLRPEQLPISWKYAYPGELLREWDFLYRIDLMDKDDDRSSSRYQELIGSVSFRVRDLIDQGGYRRSFTMRGDSTEVRIVIRWE